MTIDVDALETLLCERLCDEVRLVARPDGALMVRTPFRFPDGDGYLIHVSEALSGGVRLSDRGHTLMHASYEHDVDSFMEGSRGMLLERIMGENGLQWDGGAFCLDTTPDELADAVFRFGQALTRIYDLASLHDWRREAETGRSRDDAMNREQVLELLRTHKALLAQRFDIATVALFGSFARDQSDERSDVDVLVTFAVQPDWKRFFGAQAYLEDLLGRPVDLVIDANVRAEIRDYVKRDKIVV